VLIVMDIASSAVVNNHVASYSSETAVWRRDVAVGGASLCTWAATMTVAQWTWICMEQRLHQDDALSACISKVSASLP